MRNFNILKSDNSFDLKENNKIFITGYEVDNNMLVVTFADKHQHSYPYSKQVEEKIISLMEKQINDVIGDEQIQNNMYGAGLMLEASFLWGGLPMIVCAVGAVLTLSMPIVAALFFIGSSIEGLVLAKVIKGYILEKKAYKDYQKAKLFIENKNIMSNIDLTKNNLEKKVSKKSLKSICSATSEDNINLTINNISKLSLKQLKSIKKLIEIYKNEQLLYNGLINETQINEDVLPKQTVK